MDIVMPYKAAGTAQELRYTLRSVEKNYPEVGELWLVGDASIHMKDFRHIPNPMNQSSSYPMGNSVNAIYLACTHPKVADEFLLFNDDFFLMQPYTPRVEYRCTLAEHIAFFPNKNSAWTQTLANTYNYLRDRGVEEPLSFALHTPLPVNKAVMAYELERAKGKGISARSVYGATITPIPAQATHDSKISWSTTEDWRTWDILSTENQIFERHPVGEFIREAFPDKSRWER